MNSRTRLMTFVGAVLLSNVMAVADTWLLPRTKVYLSPNDSLRFTVTPAGDDTDKRSPCRAKMERLQSDGQWVLLWERDLQNAVAPYECFISDSGNVATCDNWGAIGYGDDVVVIYDRKGGLIRKFALADLLSEEHVKGLEHSISSIHWRLFSGTEMDSRELVIRVHDPGAPLDDYTHYSVIRIKLVDGQTTTQAVDEE